MGKGQAKGNFDVNGLDRRRPHEMDDRKAWTIPRGEVSRNGMNAFFKATQ